MIDTFRARPASSRPVPRPVTSPADRPVSAATRAAAAVEFPIPGAGYRSAFLELARRHGDYAIVGVAALAKATGGTLSDVRLAFIGAGPTPILAKSAMAAIEGKKLGPDTIAAAQATLAKDLAPTGDLNGSPATKLHLARVLCGRAIALLAS